MSEEQASGATGAEAFGGGMEPDTAVLRAVGAPGAAQQRPEVAVGAAFAGGFLLALLLRRARS